MAKFYITTSIAYANSTPHIGYAMELIQADVLARYHRSRGEEVRFVTGTDEHGLKILRAAEVEKLPPQQYVDGISQSFRDLKALLNLSNDVFIRTTQPDHKKAAQALWKACEDDIYKHSYEGWYCVGDETFYSLTEVPDKICPIHKTPLELMKEDNYFFRLSAYTDKIKALITSGDLVVTPDSRRNEILSLLNSGLEDISISREKKKLSWGVPVPDDSDQVMYVWFDALTNYLTAAGYPDKGYDAWWPADVQIIGKDILRHHAAIWVGMLLSAKLTTPKTIYVHGFIDNDGHKMSKSLGNVVGSQDVIDKYGIDGLRYYLLREIPSDADGTFSWNRAEEIYNSELANDLGNLVQRVAVMITKYFDGAVGDIPAHSHDVKAYDEAMSAIRFDRALEEVWVLVRGLNQYIDEEKPWTLSQDKARLQEVLGHAVSDLIQVAALLLPFLPVTAEKIVATFVDGKVHPEVGLLFPKADQIEKTTF